MTNRLICLGVMLVSLSVLMLELVLTRIFSVTMYYHFAFLAISLALFGSGASGIYVYLLPRFFRRERAGLHMALSAIICAFSIVAALTVLIGTNLTIAPFQDSMGLLIKAYLAAAFPFFFGGLCISLALTHYADIVSKIYFYDLAGASIGCLLVIPALNFLGGPTTMLAIMLPLLVAAILFSVEDNRRIANEFKEGESGETATAAASSSSPIVARLRAFVATLAAALLIVSCGLIVYDYKTQAFAITNAKGENWSEIILQKWNSFSRITVIGNPVKDPFLMIKIDSDAATSVVRFNGNPADYEGGARKSLTSFAYNLKDGQQPNVLIIGPGGGPDVISALAFGARKVTGVEINPIIATEIMRDRFKEYSGGLYEHPKVEIAVDEGRSYIRSSSEQFDVIQATLVDTWAATSAGAFALTENNLYTVEAFKDYATHLTPDGVLTMTRWMLDPPQQDLRLISLTRAMMSELGISNPERHIMLVKARGENQRLPITFIFKRSPFTDEEVEKMRAVCDKEGFGALYMPGYPQENIFTKLITAPDPKAVYDAYPLNIEPTYDNSPFFFNNVRVKDYRRAFTLDDESQKTNLGMYVLVALFMITIVIVGAFLIGPLALFRRDVLRTARGSRLRLVLYFACLGLGFITVEISLIQKFTLFLGHPVYALAVILFSLLLFSSIGSYLTGRLAPDALAQSGKRVIAAIWVFALVYIAALPYFFYTYVGLPLPAKIVMAIAFLIPLALVMGMPMPIGIRIANREESTLIPWAWGVNGATSVLGSVTTFILAISFGFNQALMVGLAAYALAAVLIKNKN